MPSVQAATRRKSDKIWREALVRALARRKEDGGVNAGLDELADKVVALAIAGDVSAIKEIGDRIDGKPKQQLEHTGADGGPIEQVIRDSRQSIARKLDSLAAREGSPEASERVH